MAASEVSETEHPAQAIAEEHPLVDTPQQLLVLLVLSFAVPVAILVMLAILATSGTKFDQDHPGMTDAAIAQRIKPVGQVRLAEGGAAEVPAEASATPATPAQATSAATPPGSAPAAGARAAAAGDGKAVFDKTCMACHATGLAGAPKAGDKAAWEPRLKQGMEALYATSLKGKGAMPPKGGATQLSDAEVKAAVDYMVSLVK
jgi:cytochrome c5